MNYNIIISIVSWLYVVNTVCVIMITSFGLIAEQVLSPLVIREAIYTKRYYRVMLVKTVVRCMLPVYGSIEAYQACRAMLRWRKDCDEYRTGKTQHRPSLSRIGKQGGGGLE